MQTALTLMTLFIVWVISLFLGFASGICFEQKRTRRRPKKAQKRNISTPEEDKERRYYENFLSYSGVPQEDINE